MRAARSGSNPLPRKLVLYLPFVGFLILEFTAYVPAAERKDVIDGLVRKAGD